MNKFIQMQVNYNNRKNKQPKYSMEDSLLLNSFLRLCPSSVFIFASNYLVFFTQLP